MRIASRRAALISILAAGMVACVAGTALAARPAGSPAVSAHGAAAGRVPDCRPGQLRLHNGPRVSEKTQQETAVFVLRNVSSHRCGLPDQDNAGYPVVALWTALTVHGRYLPFRYREHGDQMLTGDKPQRVVLASGGRAYFGINKNACVGRSTGTARYITIFPLGQLHQKLRKYPVLGYCGRHDPGHVVDISPFEKTVRAVLAKH
jgi:hypothetical protein